jgi:rare lipoprotein A
VARIAVVACALALAGLAALPARAAAESAKPEVPPGSRYVLGKPFQFDGVWYRPAVDYDYDTTGLAVVYDPRLAGGRTTNGEIYDGKALTAAHKTLPLPSLVQVTNLDNGWVVTVRVDDRGPFVDDQVIDLSGAAAAVLGITSGSQGRVRVQILAAESWMLARAYGAAAPGTSDAAPSLAAVPAPQLSIQPLPAGGAPSPATTAPNVALAALPAKPATANPQPPRSRPTRSRPCRPPPGRICPTRRPTRWR